MIKTGASLKPAQTPKTDVLDATPRNRILESSDTDILDKTPTSGSSPLGLILDETPRSDATWMRQDPLTSQRSQKGKESAKSIETIRETKLDSDGIVADIVEDLSKAEDLTAAAGEDATYLD